MLLVEQHVDLALAIADRAYVLSHGDLVLANDAQHLRENRHLLEASYVGGPIGAADRLRPCIDHAGGT